MITVNLVLQRGHSACPLRTTWTLDHSRRKVKQKELWRQEFGHDMLFTLSRHIEHTTSVEDGLRGGDVESCELFSMFDVFSVWISDKRQHNHRVGRCVLAR